MNKDKDLEQVLSYVSERTRRAAKQHWYEGRYDAIIERHKGSLIAEAEEYAHNCIALTDEITQIKGGLEDWQKRHEGERGLWKIVRNLFDTYSQPSEKQKLASKEDMLKEYEDKVGDLKKHVDKLDSSSYERDRVVAGVVLEDVRTSRSIAKPSMWLWIQKTRGVEHFGHQCTYWTDGFHSERRPENDWSLRQYDTVMLPDGYAIGITRYADYNGSRRREDMRVFYHGYLFDLDNERPIGTFPAGSNGGWKYQGITNIEVKPNDISFEVVKGSYSRPSHTKHSFDPRPPRLEW